jgi:hypothetical protein
MPRMRELESADADFLGVMLYSRLYARLADVEYEPGDDLGRMIPTLTA